MGALKEIKYFLFGLSKVFEYIGWVFLLGWVALLTAGTVMRYIFRQPFVFQSDVTSAMLVVFCTFCLAPVFLQGEHIRTDLIMRRLPERARDLLWLFAEFMLMAFAILASLSTFDLTSHYIEIDARLDISNIPKAPLVIAIPVGLGLLTLVVFIDFCECLSKLLKRR